jgi:hypothetical protein
MGNSFKLNALLLTVALSIGFTMPLRAATIFDNSTHDLLTRFNPGTNEVGDEIVLGSTERYLTGFSFEFWGTNTASASSFAGQIQARVRMYQNDGQPFNGYAAPGSTFFDSGWFSLNTLTGPTPRSTLLFSEGTDFPAGGLFMPLPITVSNLTWSVQFEGMGATDSVGVDLYSPPTVGQDYPDYWQVENGSWVLLTNTVAMDFAAQMFANQQIPEPSVVALSVLSGLGVLVFACRLRRKQ